jgi:hypothetical protein
MSRSSPRPHRYLILAAVVAGLGVSAGVLTYLYQDRSAQGEAGTGSPDTTQASPGATPDAIQQSPATEPAGATLAESGDDSVTPASGRADTRVDADTQGPVSLVVENSLSSIAARSATVEQVIEALRGGLAIEIIDLRSADASDAEDEQPRRLSFSFSGTVDETLRFVMGQYGYNYAITYRAPEVTSEPPSVAKLFLYGSPQAAEPGDLAAGVDTTVTDRADAADSKTGVAAGEPLEPKPTVAEVLRSRALHSGQTLPRATGVQGGSAIPGAVSPANTSDAGDTGDAGDASYASEEDRLNAQLADMTRRARQDVEALVDGLKQVEDSLKAAQGNAP